MKKIKFIMSLIILITIIIINPVFADNYTKSYCVGFNGVFRIIGEIVNIIKIVVPLIIIGLATSDMFKSVTSGKDDSIFKALKGIASRIILGVLIFFLPSILDFGFSLIDEWSNYELGYQECASCILNVSECR